MISIAQVSAFVGFDYHDSFVQVCVLDNVGKVLGNRRVVNDATAILKFVEVVRDGREAFGHGHQVWLSVGLRAWGGAEESNRPATHHR